jgi:hypothetical protein
VTHRLGGRGACQFRRRIKVEPPLLLTPRASLFGGRVSWFRVLASLAVGLWLVDQPTMGRLKASSTDAQAMLRWGLIRMRILRTCVRWMSQDIMRPLPARVRFANSHPRKSWGSEQMTSPWELTSKQRRTK